MSQPVRPTPGPWKQRVLSVEDEFGVPVAHCTRWEGRGVSPRPEVAEANAALIVRAVNCHEQLLDALRAFCGDFESTRFRIIELDAAYQHAKAAIAQAEAGVRSTDKTRQDDKT